jgi:hypothetical protein
LQFQWYFNDVALLGATNASLILQAVDPTAAGKYEVVVSNPAGVTDSQPAKLIITGVDSDGDGIPDSWMSQHFGHVGALASDYSRAQDDPDNDGMSNLQEYLAGTDPLDPLSCLQLQLRAPSPGTAGPVLSFTAMAGIDYTLQHCDDLSSGFWHRLNDIPADPTTHIVSLNELEIPPSGTRFYRVVTPLRP